MNIDDLMVLTDSRNSESAIKTNRLSALAKEVSGIRNNIKFLKSEIDHLLHNPEYDPDYPELLTCIHEEVKGLLDMFPADLFDNHRP
jgi:hypothetical protein